MNEYKTGKVAAWVGGQHENTIRDWSKRYAAYLSKNANAGRRRYSDDDVRVLATIAAYRVQGLSFDAIESALKDGKRLSAEEMPAEPSEEEDEARAGVDIIHMPKDVYLRQLERLKYDIEAREIELEQTKEQLYESRADRERLQQRVNELQTEIGAARAELEIIKQERRPASEWLRTIAVVIVFVVALFIVIAGAIYFFNSLP